MTLRRRTPGLVLGLAATLAAMTLAGCTAATPDPTTPPASPADTVMPTTTPTATDPLPAGAVDALIIGSDSRTPGSMTGNADTIMLAHLTAERDKVYLISFTRDMWVKIPGLGEGKINSAFSRGGTETLTATVSNLLGGGIDPEYTLQTDFSGFIAMTRALEGIPVDNQHATTSKVNSTGRIVRFDEGDIVLENTDGLIYVRERKQLPLGDLDRTERQRATVTGMLDKIPSFADDPAALTMMIGHLVGNSKITGPMGVDTALALVPLAQELDREDVVSLMVPITGYGTRGGASVNLVDTTQTAALGEAVRTDTLDDYVAEFGTDYAP